MHLVIITVSANNIIKNKLSCFYFTIKTPFYVSVITSCILFWDTFVQVKLAAVSFSKNVSFDFTTRTGVDLNKLMKDHSLRIYIFSNDIKMAQFV